MIDIFIPNVKVRKPGTRRYSGLSKVPQPAAAGPESVWTPSIDTEVLGACLGGERREEGLVQGGCRRPG